MRTEQMIAANPRPLEPAGAIARCIDACLDCAQACAQCADACLGEEHVKMLTTCIRLDELCGQICLTTAFSLARHDTADGVISKAQLKACALACDFCAAECEQHAARHSHCRICAETCRDCEAACQALVDHSLGQREPLFVG